MCFKKMALSKEIMNGIKRHPLGPSFADDVAGLNRWL